MKNNLYIFIDVGLTVKDHNRYSIRLLKKKFNVKIVDLSRLLFPNYNHTSKLFKDELNELILEFKTKDAIIEFINKKLKNSLVLFTHYVNKKSFFIFNQLYRNKINFGFLYVNSTPDNYELYSKSYFKIKRSFRNFFFNFFYGTGMTKANFFIVGSETDKLKALYDPLHTKNSKIYHYNTLDYNIFNKNEELFEIKSKYKSKFCVFLDEFNPYHSDNEVTGFNFDINSYYKELNSFFSKIEKKLKLKIFIAAHPSSNYDVIGNPYSKRLIFKNKTDYLIRESKFVLAHASTALNFAVLYKKPVLLVKSKNYPHRYNKSISIFAKELNCESVFVDDKIREYKLSVDKNSYDMYVKKFIKINPNLNVSFDKLINNINNDLL